MAKNKLAKWAELSSFTNVIEQNPGETTLTDHSIKGNWNRDMFGNNNPVTVELGCGKGEYTTGLSEIFPGRNFIGVDIKGARMWRGAKTAGERGLKNTAFLRTRIEFIDSFFARDEVDEIWLTFPDPHPGKRNSNKRLTCPWFLNKYRCFLKDRGIVHLKTDNDELCDYTKKVALFNSLEILYSAADLYSGNPDNELPGIPSGHFFGVTPERTGILSIRTHYENMFVEKGLKIHYLAFRLERDKIISYGPQKGTGG